MSAKQPSLELKIQELFEILDDQGEHDLMGVKLEIDIWDNSQKPLAYYAQLTVPTFTNVRGAPQRKAIAGDGSHSYSIENAIDLLLAELKEEDE